MAKFYDKNNLQLGIGIGLILPMLAWGILNAVYWLLAQRGLIHANLSSSFSERTIGLLAIAVNIIPMRYYQKSRYFINTMRGVTIAMAVLAFVWMAFYLPEMFAKA